MPPIGQISSGFRFIKDGSRFNGLFPQSENKSKIEIKDGDAHDTVRLMGQVVRTTTSQTKQLAERLQRSSLKDTCNSIWDFLYSHIQYKLDTPGLEELRQPARSWKDRKSGIDCDCFSIFVSSILTNLNIYHAFRITKYDGKDNFQHVYIIVPIPGTSDKYYTIDCVLSQFDYEKPYSQKKDFVMKNTLNGIDVAVLSGFDGENDELFDVISGAHFEGVELGSVSETEALYAHLVLTRKVVAKRPELIRSVDDPNAFLKMLDYALMHWHTPQRDLALSVLAKNETAINRLNGFLEGEDELFGDDELDGDEDFLLGKPRAKKMFRQAKKAAKREAKLARKTAKQQAKTDRKQKRLDAKTTRKAARVDARTAKKVARTTKRASKKLAKIIDKTEEVPPQPQLPEAEDLMLQQPEYESTEEQTFDEFPSESEDFSTEQEFEDENYDDEYYDEEDDLEGLGKGKFLESLKKVGKAVVRFNPVTIASRSGFLLALKLNIGKMGSKLKWGYATEAQAAKKGVNKTKWQAAKKSLADTEALFEKLGGKKQNLKNPILKGKAGGLDGVVEYQPELEGLGVVAVGTAVTAAVPVIVKIIQSLKKNGLMSDSEASEAENELNSSSFANELENSVNAEAGTSGSSGVPKWVIPVAIAGAAGVGFYLYTKNNKSKPAPKAQLSGISKKVKLKKITLK